MYNVNLDVNAKKFLKKLDKNNQDKIIKKLKRLRGNPHLGKPLSANLRGLWSLRIEKYRIVYRIIEDKLLVLVINIGHRKNIYG